MFAKNRQDETARVIPNTPVPTAQPAAPQPQPVVPSKGATRNRASSVIGGDLVVKGSLFSAGDVQLEGKVEGDIRARALIIGENATVIGDIYAEEAIVRGRIKGNINANKTQLCSSCHVEGDILHKALSVEVGAFFEGNCRPSDNPVASSLEDKASMDVESSAPLQPVVELHPPHPSRPKPAASSIDDEYDELSVQAAT